eukprot:s958_g21.t1
MCRSGQMVIFKGHAFAGVIGKQKEHNSHNWAVLVKELLGEMILAKQPILYIQILLAGAAMRSIEAAALLSCLCRCDLDESSVWGAQRVASSKTSRVAF